MTSSPNLTILSDNYASVPGLASVWGFAARLRAGGHTLLFDTGSNGRVLLKNAAVLGVDLGAAELAIFSHIHWDHIGGMDSFIELNPHATVVVHDGFSKHLVADLRTMCDRVLVVGEEPVELFPGILSTGMLTAEPPEQSLVLDVDGVTAVISGCAHPGIERIVARGVEMLGKPVDWAIGGFHLMYSDADEIERTIRMLQDLGVSHVVPTHCTGNVARAHFQRVYGPGYVEGGVGRELTLTPH
ncbi:MAG: MBL fold metallo-hydrolase [Actinomycetota bacterium]